MSLGFGGKSAQLASYFQEVADHFATLEDAEEKALLAANAVEEVFPCTALGLPAEPMLLHAQRCIG